MQLRVTVRHLASLHKVRLGGGANRLPLSGAARGAPRREVGGESTGSRRQDARSLVSPAAETAPPRFSWFSLERKLFN